MNEHGDHSELFNSMEEAAATGAIKAFAEQMHNVVVELEGAGFARDEAIRVAIALYTVPPAPNA